MKYAPPWPEIVIDRFSETGRSSSYFPNLKFSQLEPHKLSNRTNAFSKWKAAVLSDKGTTLNKIFLNKGAPNQRSKAERSKPAVVTFPAVVVFPLPGTASTAWWSELSRCH